MEAPELPFHGRGFCSLVNTSRRLLSGVVLLDLDSGGGPLLADRPATCEIILRAASKGSIDSI